MTLLEAITALVILSLSAVGYLDLFHGGSRAIRDASEWGRLVSIAESTMEEASLGGSIGAQAPGLPRSDGFARVVEHRPWRGHVSEIVVSVTSPRGVTFTLQRLARDRR
ncbi:MAG: hypothetical protein ABIT38_13100 [Gemmatimonadaceae bacterium]